MGILVWAQGVEKIGLDRDLNPGPRAPKARIIPLDHQAAMVQAPDPAVAPKRWESLVTMEIEIVKNIYLVSMEIWLIIHLSNLYASETIPADIADYGNSRSVWRWRFDVSDEPVLLFVARSGL